MKHNFLLALFALFVAVPLIALVGLVGFAQYLIVAYAFSKGLWWGIAAIVGLVWANLFAALGAWMEGK